MMNEATISDALDEVSAELLLGRDFAEVLRETADAFGIRVVVLQNRAEKAFGDLATYASRKMQTAQKIDEQKVICEISRFERAMNSAIELDALYSPQSPYFGKVFEWNDEKYIFVCRDGGRHVWGIRAICISDNTRRKFTNDCESSIVRQFNNAL